MLEVYCHMCVYRKELQSSLGIKDYSTGYCLREALIGRRGDHVEQIVPGYHAYDGSYTSLTLTWRQVKLKVETAVENQCMVRACNTFEHWNQN